MSELQGQLASLDNIVALVNDLGKWIDAKTSRFLMKCVRIEIDHLDLPRYQRFFSFDATNIVSNLESVALRHERAIFNGKYTMQS